MTDLGRIADALLLMAGEDEHADNLTGLDQISNRMKQATDHRSSDTELLSAAILTAADSVAGALNRIADAIESRD